MLVQSLHHRVAKLRGGILALISGHARDVGEALLHTHHHHDRLNPDREPEHVRIGALAHGQEPITLRVDGGPDANLCVCFTVGELGAVRGRQVLDHEPRRTVETATARHVFELTHVTSVFLALTA